MGYVSFREGIKVEKSSANQRQMVFFFGRMKIGISGG